MTKMLIGIAVRPEIEGLGANWNSRRYFPPHHVRKAGWSHSPIPSRASQEASAAVVLGNSATLRGGVPPRATRTSAGEGEGWFSECVAISLEERSGSAILKSKFRPPRQSVPAVDAPLSLSRYML